MYHCINCLQEYEDEYLVNNRVNTMDRSDVFQCDKCFCVDGLIYGLYEECPLCLTNKTSMLVRRVILLRLLA